MMTKQMKRLRQKARNGNVKFMNYFSNAIEIEHCIPSEKDEIAHSIIQSGDLFGHENQDEARR